jgi:uncharacterized protein (TIGR03435 family)
MRIVARIASTGLAALLAGPAFCQSAEPRPQFEIADVHPTPKTNNRIAIRRGGQARGGRYEMMSATLSELISTAYGFGEDKVLGGPSWLEMDRFDVAAKVDPDSTPETQKLMLQSLLAERFGLVVRKETQPVPAYALVAGKKPLLKPADGEGAAGCKPQAAGGPNELGFKLSTMNNGVSTVTNVGPGGLIQFHCRNMSMAAFAEALGGLFGASDELGPNPVMDKTGLEGRWNFDLKYSVAFFAPMVMAGGERITLFEAVEKQLGLKLEQRQVPTPVLVVVSANRVPSPNPPGVAEALPPIVAPTEFEVADVKPSQPGGRGGAFRFQPGGRVTAVNRPMRLLLIRAFASFNADELVGVPSWADSTFFDITAKAPSSPSMPQVDFNSLAPLLRSLLAERFGLKYHTEERPMNAYSLVAAKPKLKKADPASRTWCKYPNAPSGAPAGTEVINCQNITMAEFAGQLQGTAPELNWPVQDATGIEGRWDLTVTYSRNFPMMTTAMAAMATVAGPGRGGDAGAPGNDMASDPAGGIAIFQALEKQLGLKLEMRKRLMPVTVIDHLEQKPSDN